MSATVTSFPNLMTSIANFIGIFWHCVSFSTAVFLVRNSICSSNCLFLISLFVRAVDVSLSTSSSFLLTPESKPNNLIDDSSSAISPSKYGQLGQLCSFSLVRGLSRFQPLLHLVMIKIYLLLIHIHLILLSRRASHLTVTKKLLQSLA